uniref:ARM repeat superfamily protein n=1 Tax=Chenopodium quinoa TaxID=63459 RepID=A0A803MXQ3_CHEQI
MDLNKDGFLSDEAQNSSTFCQLKSCCLELLDLLQNPKKQSPAVSQLLALLRSLTSEDVEPFFDYILFPLLLLMDAAVDCRSVQKRNCDGKSEMLFDHQTLKVSDAVSEGVLQCLEELFTKCRLVSVNQMTVVLKTLTHGAMLSPLEAAEEFREGVVKCFRTLISNIISCSDTSCSCKHSLSQPLLLDTEDFRSSTAEHLECHSQPKECLIAFLQSESSSAAVGHWLSLLLNIAEAESSRGLRGSAKIRIEALLTLRILVAKVGTPDALAFFLPGVVSKLAGILNVSKSMISGAAGSTEATDHAVRGLAEFLIVVLQVDANIFDPRVSRNNLLASLSYENESPQSFLEELRHMHVKAQDRIQTPANSSCLKTPNTKEEEKQSHKISGGLGPLHVKRTRDWLEKTSVNIDCLLSKIFPHDCLCNLACDDSEDVSLPAQDVLGLLFSSDGKYTVEDDLAEIFSRLLEKLPKFILGCEESLALASAQQMLAVIYYSGPQLVVDHLLRSPIKAAKLFDVFALCLSEESVFAGSLGKIVLSRPSSTGYLHSLAELKIGSKISEDQYPVNNSNIYEVSNMHTLVKEMEYSEGQTYENYELPRMPPWFANVNFHKLYQALAGILRLVGLSLISDYRNEVPLSKIIEIPLDNLRKLVFEIRRKEYNSESWESWYARTNSGQLLRQAGTAACILNEMLFGMSDQAMNVFGKIFKNSGVRIEEKQNSDATAFGHSCQVRCHVAHGSHWQTKGAENVLIEGIGIFNTTLREQFASSGFLCSSLYLLLENLMCSNSDVRHASDVVLRLISATSGCSSVGHLVMLNSDYVIDSLCHQLRHLDLNPHVPNVLAAMLSCVGVTHKILALLEEPMRSVSMELEILGRHQHPELTIHFLKAVAEMVKAAKHEAQLLPAQAESFLAVVNSKVSDVKMELERDTVNAEEPEPCDVAFSRDIVVTVEEWENILFKLHDNKRYRRIVASVAVSCFRAVTPLLGSEKEPICLIALNVIEDGFVTLANVEEAFRHEKEAKGGIEEVASLCSFYHLKDILDVAEEGNDENRLLPTMNTVWPYLVACVRNRIPAPVRRCAEVISNVVKICGGDFFSRRFHTDGSHFWKLLSTSPFKRKPISSDEKAPLLPYRSTSRTLEDPISESSNLKTQVAVLRMIAELSRDKKSASALEVVLKKVSGLVVGIACSGVTGLRDASIDALSGLASIDPDLIWLQLADVYYSSKEEDAKPSSSGFPELAEILPRPMSSKDYLYAQYGGQSYGFDVNFSSVENAFRILYPEMFLIQAQH